MILRSNIEALDRLHMTDQLTGMYNRYALMRFSEKYTAGKVYSIAMLDMDWLKSINDQYGHLAGNNAICILADAIKKKHIGE
ncbi:MAG: diguanylate cyclase [Lachnospiraceae bacterium]|nr:diguanylate cyclase [Lachnospiraceae bacterium]